MTYEHTFGLSKTQLTDPSLDFKLSLKSPLDTDPDSPRLQVDYCGGFISTPTFYEDNYLTISDSGSVIFEPQNLLTSHDEAIMPCTVNGTLSDDTTDP